jgi:hypothetical protein
LVTFGTDWKVVEVLELSLELSLLFRCVGHPGRGYDGYYRQAVADTVFIIRTI